MTTWISALDSAPLDPETRVRTFDVANVDHEMLIGWKAGRTISMCFPCRDEGATIGPLVSAAREHLVDRHPVLDELVVIDDRSTDDTAMVAADAGARVVQIEDIHAQHGVGHGKGNVLWASMQASTGDIVVWCDGDVTSFRPDWVLHLVAPLLQHDEVALVKAKYDRPTGGGGGGRTTELVARPLLSLYFPELTALAQPLSGEFAGRRSMLERIPFVEGWGAEIAMLIDLSREFGAASIGQVDLGERHHRHRSLHSLTVQASEVLATTLGRAGVHTGIDLPALTRADGSMVPLNLAERPPIRP